MLNIAVLILCSFIRRRWSSSFHGYFVSFVPASSVRNSYWNSRHAVWILMTMLNKILSVFRSDDMAVDVDSFFL